MKRTLWALLLLVGFIPVKASEDYMTSPQYLALRDSMHHAFNDSDSARFFVAIKNLENYILEKDDLHNYYTQRCNEIVFLMNAKKIFEAYKLSRQLSQELQERKLDKEMYMAYNMLGHIYRHCGNEKEAKRMFNKVIELLEQAGYYESMPPIYMNIVNVEVEKNPKEALSILDEALNIAEKYSPERVFDINARRTLSYYSMGEKEKFLEGYKAYKKGEAEGKSSVHGRSLEVHYLASLGQIDDAIKMAREELGEESYGTIASLYKDAGRWQEAYEALKKETELNDSINSLILSNSIQGYRSELKLYDLERQNVRNRTVTMVITILLLLLLIMALVYIMFSRRYHMNLLKQAYEHALESDKMKTLFIQNMSHEVRTPLNIISGFAQVLANPELSSNADTRQEMAQMMLKNTHIITTQIEEMLELSFNEASGAAIKDDEVNVGSLLESLIAENKVNVEKSVEMRLENKLEPGFVFKTHREMLKRALNALIDNAAKNTMEGTITLRASADFSNLKLTVEDTGCGIPEEESEHIFERFVKIDTFKQGLGLGLPLCRMIVTRLGGIILLDTSYKSGARFVVTLPI